VLDQGALRQFRPLFEVVRGELGPRCGSVWLIRPDGYLAATGADAITDYLRRLFGAPSAVVIAPEGGPVVPKAPELLGRAGER
jgi:hypothetical protein